MRSIKLLKRIHFNFSLFLKFLQESQCATLFSSSGELVNEIFLLGVSNKNKHISTSFFFLLFCFYIPKVTFKLPFLHFAVCPNIVVKISQVLGIGMTSVLGGINHQFAKFIGHFQIFSVNFTQRVPRSQRIVASRRKYLILATQKSFP